MRTNQKFFSLRDPSTSRITGYIVVANRETPDDGATILAGNARVLAARLADAEFFWENDLRTPLADMAVKLAGVTFHNKLGTQADRIARIAALAREIAPSVGADPALAERAAKLAKADLASQMVYEFPALQGTMGRYYALAAGEHPAVAAAAPEHYAPLGPSDAVPTAPVSVAVALADKLDMLARFWDIDEKPTGSSDPFALRRAALGLIRILLDGGFRLHLVDVVHSHLERRTGRRSRRLVFTPWRSLRGKRPSQQGLRGTRLLPRRPPQGPPARPGHPPRRDRRLFPARRPGRPGATGGPGSRAAGLPRHRRRRAPADRLQARHQHRRGRGAARTASNTPSTPTRASPRPTPSAPSSPPSTPPRPPSARRWRRRTSRRR